LFRRRRLRRHSKDSRPGPAQVVVARSLLILGGTGHLLGVVGGLVRCVSGPFALVSGPLSFIGDVVALVGGPLSFIGGVLRPIHGCGASGQTGLGCLQRLLGRLGAGLSGPDPGIVDGHGGDPLALGVLDNLLGQVGQLA